MNYGYLRIGKYEEVTTFDKEITEIQKFNISGDIIFDRVNTLPEQKNLNDLLKKLQKGDEIITYDLWTLFAPSNSSKTMSNIARIIHYLQLWNEHGITVVFANPDAPVIQNIIWTYLDQTSLRLKNEAIGLGLARKKATGMTVGRPKLRLDEHEVIRLWLARNKDGSRKNSVGTIAIKMGCSRPSIVRTIKRLMAEGKLSA